MYMHVRDEHLKLEVDGQLELHTGSYLDVLVKVAHVHVHCR